jgi:hypothetical protein
MPESFAARAMRTAISPRLAIRTLVIFLVAIAVIIANSIARNRLIIGKPAQKN